jgi:hypothetical protein
VNVSALYGVTQIFWVVYIQRRVVRTRRFLFRPYESKFGTAAKGLPLMIDTLQLLEKVNQKGRHNFGHTKSSGCPMISHKSLIGMEAAIGIEPMNKGFAVHFEHLLLSIMECHSCIIKGFLCVLCYSMTLYLCR